MIKTESVGWSNKYTKNTCSNCGKKNTLQTVQNQKKVKIGRFKIINIGPRDFNFECSNCMTLTAMNKAELRHSKRLGYYFQRPTKENIFGKSELTKNVKYPVLTPEKRNRIRHQNKIEGFMSAVLGTVVGLILLIWFSWAIWISVIFITLGLYAAFEDPEMKFRGDIEKAKDIHGPKTRKGRHLK